MMLVFDLETTGLTLHPAAKLDAQPRIIEFGGVVLDGKGKTVSEHSVLIHPAISLPPEIVKITGITDQELSGALTFAKAAPTLRAVFKGVKTVVAHNLPFDKSVFMYELERNNIADWPWPPRELCTVQLFAPEWGRNPRLVELYERVMGTPLAQTHRALDDTRALAEIVVKERLYQL